MTGSRDRGPRFFLRRFPRYLRSTGRKGEGVSWGPTGSAGQTTNSPASGVISDSGEAGRATTRPLRDFTLKASGCRRVYTLLPAEDQGNCFLRYQVQDK